MLFPLLALLSLVATATAAAVPVTAAKATGATTNVTTFDAWTYFGFGDNGSSTDPYSATLQDEGCLIVSDAYCSGDQFAIAINGTDQGLTSTPAGAWCSVTVGDDVESALTKPEFSKGYFPLPPGTSTYNITVVTTQQGSGGAYFKVSSTTCPAPFNVVPATGANTTNVTATDEWIYFGFGGNGPSNNTYSVTMQDEGCLIVSDAYCSGDQFAVAINGTDPGLTSTPAGGWCSVAVGDDVESALTKPEFSKGYFPLPPGTSTYNITVVTTQGGGGAYFKISPTTCPPFVPATGANTTGAITNVTTFDAWTYFSFGGNGPSNNTYSVTMQDEGCLIVSDAYCSGDQFAVAINGTDKVLTSTPAGAWCNVTVGDNVESALTKPEFSKGYFPLPPGTSIFNITTANKQGSGGAFFKISSMTCPAPFKIVTSAGKLLSRAAAVSACEDAGMALADVTPANLNEVADMVRKSPDTNLNPVDAVLVNSWNGDTFGNVDLQTTVSATTSAVMMRMGQAFPLCQGSTA
ncbi:hypothetical protein GGF31_006484 [Allomyces arbusculus]|nr:hypothetical protein GGF31_006484 [Allomyces arbusculus]